MNTLNVSMERNGKMVFVGQIMGTDASDSVFRYSPGYLLETDAAPISISLPLQEQAFSAKETGRFFEGMLPEGFTKRTVAEWLHVREDDYIPILYGLGRECLGAIYISEDGEELEAAYEPIPRSLMHMLAAEGATKSAELVTKSHISLTGASGKVGLYYHAPQDAWYLPKGAASSPHIVRQSHVRLRGIVANEQLALSTAALR